MGTVTTYYTVKTYCGVFFIITLAGTDDDLPPTHRNRFQSGVRTAGNGRSTVVCPASLPRLHSDMETQIHTIEQEAYTSVLRAFKAQSDAITWVEFIFFPYVTFTFCYWMLNEHECYFYDCSPPGKGKSNYRAQKRTKSFRRGAQGAPSQG